MKTERIRETGPVKLTQRNMAITEEILNIENEAANEAAAKIREHLLDHKVTRTCIEQTLRKMLESGMTHDEAKLYAVGHMERLVRNPY